MLSEEIIVIVREVGIGSNLKSDVFFYHFLSIFHFDFHCIIRGYSDIIGGEVQILFGGPENFTGGLEILHLPFQGNKLHSNVNKTSCFNKLS